MIVAPNRYLRRVDTAVLSSLALYIAFAGQLLWSLPEGEADIFKLAGNVENGAALGVRWPMLPAIGTSFGQGRAALSGSWRGGLSVAVVCHHSAPAR